MLEHKTRIKFYMTKTEARTPKATDPATANLFDTAAFSAGAGASDGVSEIDGGVAGVEEGGEFTVVGDGADVGGVLEGAGADAGGVVTGEGDGEVVVGVGVGAGARTGRGAWGEGDGDVVGDCAMVEPNNKANSVNKTTPLEFAIVDNMEAKIIRKNRGREQERRRYEKMRSFGEWRVPSAYLW
ncbi:hypothetical protein HS088_TW18G00614 [Tripterygium wilfordii]|uniref:Uncharacterized protein n=1 Tax=Tripterygium wilfordii TaxID=458696 RepID=A0A7J7CDG4_TRIWF|nr:hypothetical protein HS088_TW18G00614 [Tripterygium wilfordii]